MKLSIFLFLIAACLGGFSSCSKDETEPFDQRFIHIMQAEASATTVSARANAVGTYTVYLSSPQFFDTVVVKYKITPGDGLLAGRDYELINTSGELSFLPGIYDMPIRVKWMANPIDNAKNNTLTIELLSNNKNIALGLPGPAKKQTIFTITKVD